jgi:Domain of unknown function (DUF5916)
MSELHAPLLALALLATGAVVARAQSTTVSDRLAIRIGSAGEAIRLDGELREGAWQRVDSITMLSQVEPQQGNAPSARTVVRVVATAGAIVFGIRADNPPGIAPVAFARQRDAALDSEDHIKLVLDTYLDGRSGYVFAVNPNGARYDALVASQGGEEDSNWDAVWEAAATQDANGWSVEIRIPLKSLLFRRGLSEWGFNVQRRIQRLQETDRWSSPQHDYKITHVGRAGLLTALPAFDLGVGLSVRPALSASMGKPAPNVEAEHDADASLDVTQRLGANSLASLTVNTDFAETEVDTRRTNLTRFPLVFPEKRTFFLEGSDIFAFGLGTNDDVRPFFSRRIGLLENQEVPLDVGLKASGREYGTNVGALVVRTGDADAAGIDTLPTANTMGVLRLRQNVLGESSAGFIATVGDPVGRGNSWLGGPDLTYQTSRFRGDKNFLVGVWGLAMDRDGLEGRKRAWGGKIDYPNDLWDIALTYKWLGDGFDPSLGFVPRPGVQIVNFNANFQPRPKRPILGLHVRQMFNEFENTLVTDLGGKWESYRIFMAPVNWRLESGDRFEFNVVPVGERLTSPFEIADGVVLNPGSYHWTRFRLEGGLASKRKLSAQLTWWFGDFYTGRLDELSLTASWKPSPLFIVELNGTRNSGRLDEGDFTQEVLGTRFRVNISPDLQVNSYVQYDNGSDDFGTNTRLRWTFSPLGELFVVYNHNMARELVTGDVPGTTIDRRRWGFASNELLVKLQYAFRY